jgi:aminoglycoside phosphotransferase (APT) family kinase protein
MTVETDRALSAAAHDLAHQADFDQHVVRALDRGLSSDLFTIHAYEASAPVAVVKLQRGHRAKIYAESAALDYLEARSTDGVPRVLLAAPEHAPPAVVLTWLPSHGTLEERRDHRSDALGRAFGRWLARLHDTDVSGDRVKMSTDPLTLTQRLRTQARDAVRRADNADTHHDLLARSLAWLEKRLDDSPPLGQPRRMVHRDLRPQNVLVDKGDQLAGVVDFEHAAAADPAWDFAKLRWWCFDRIDWLEEPFVEGYTAIRDLPSAATRRLFRVFEALTLLAYFSGKHAIYEREARRQLQSELDDAPRPKWSGDW